jgi:hypothetical protein
LQSNCEKMGRIGRESLLAFKCFEALVATL